MRMILGLLLLAAPACNVDSDTANEKVTVEYNKHQIRDTAVKAGETARTLAAGAGNVAVAAGRAISNEVGDVDVDVAVRRNPPNKAPPQDDPQQKTR